MLSNTRPNAALYVLRSLTSRVRAVAERHAERDDRLKVAGNRLIADCARFEQEYDRVQELESQNRVLKPVSEASSAALAGAIVDWCAVLGSALPVLTTDRFRPQRSIPEEVIRAAQDLHSVVEAHHTATPLEDGETTLSNISSLIATAQAQLDELQTGLAREQDLRSSTREHAAQLEVQLRAYRRLLGRLIGNAHRDVYALRTQRRAEPEAAKTQAEQSEASQTAAAQTAATAVNGTLTAANVAGVNGTVTAAHVPVANAQGLGGEQTAPPEQAFSLLRESQVVPANSNAVLPPLPAPLPEIAAEEEFTQAETRRPGEQAVNAEREEHGPESVAS